MRKLFYVAAVSAAVFAGCAQNDVIDGGIASQTEQSGAIGFKGSVGNSSKSYVPMASANHYEFGVYAYQNDGYNDLLVMQDYLVAYGEDGHYANLHGAATTYGDENSTITGQSQWFYQGLGYDKHTDFKTPEVEKQILKYWDESKRYTNFYAYAPYATFTTTTTSNPKSVAYSGGDIKYSSLTSFYTFAEKGISGNYQTKGADERSASLTSTPKDYVKEMLNYNEALYAYENVPMVNYGQDVAVQFKHINAKINLKFYEVVDGYSIQLTDMVPEVISATGFKKVDKQGGIVLTPAKIEQVQAIKQAPEAELPSYHEVADVTVTPQWDLITLDGSVVNSNLVFASPKSQTLGTSAGGATASATTLYVLPNEGIIDSKAEERDVTGYTLHVSYKLIPDDGASTIQVYDARVWIPADKCQWEAGKAYTYYFKITSASNGSTNPYKVDPDPEVDDEFWADPRDPRVDEDPALNPIVFDNVEVQEYNNIEVLPENVITDNTLTEAFANAWKNATPKSGYKSYYFSALSNYNTLTLSGLSAADFLPENPADVNTCIFTNDLVNLFKQFTKEGAVKKIIIDGMEYVWGENKCLYPGETTPESGFYCDGAAAGEYLPAFKVAGKVADAFLGGAKKAEVVVTFADDTKQYDVTLVYNGTPFTKFDILWLNVKDVLESATPLCADGNAKFAVSKSVNPLTYNITLGKITPDDLEIYDEDKNNVITDLRTALFCLDRSLVESVDFGGFNFKWAEGDAEGLGNWVTEDDPAYPGQKCALQSEIATSVFKSGNLTAPVTITVNDKDENANTVKLQLTADFSLFDLAWAGVVDDLSSLSCDCGDGTAVFSESANGLNFGLILNSTGSSDFEGGNVAADLTNAFAKFASNGFAKILFAGAEYSWNGTVFTNPEGKDLQSVMTEVLNTEAERGVTETYELSIKPCFGEVLKWKNINFYFKIND